MLHAFSRRFDVPVTPTIVDPPRDRVDRIYPWAGHIAKDRNRYVVPVRITKYTHSCVRLEADERVLVIDPGTWSEAYALRGADAVLVTHAHADHLDLLRLIGLGVPVYAPAEAAIPQLAVRRVHVGEDFTAGGFRVRAVGGRHATVYNEQPDCPNLGYVVEDALYHPGDALHVPAQRIDTLLVPIQASWLKTAEALDFVRAVDARQTFPIHDGQVNERGLASLNGWFAEQASGYRWLSPEQSSMVAT